MIIDHPPNKNLQVQSGNCPFYTMALVPTIFPAVEHINTNQIPTYILGTVIGRPNTGRNLLKFEVWANDSTTSCSVLSYEMVSVEEKTKISRQKIS